MIELLLETGADLNADCRMLVDVGATVDSHRATAAWNAADSISKNPEEQLS